VYVRPIVAAADGHDVIANPVTMLIETTFSANAEALSVTRKVNEKVPAADAVPEI
jgi:hypothetical protein